MSWRKHVPGMTSKSLSQSYQDVFTSPDGQIVLNHLMKVSGVTKPVSHQDSGTLRENAGQQRLVLSILRQVYQKNELQQHIQDNIQQ